jgi:hypothetical protein
VREIGVFDLFHDEGFEGGTDAEGATTIETEIDLLVYFSCREVVLSIGIRQIFSPVTMGEL